MESEDGGISQSQESEMLKLASKQDQVIDENGLQKMAAEKTWNIKAFRKQMAALSDMSRGTAIRLRTKSSADASLSMSAISQTSVQFVACSKIASSPCYSDHGHGQGLGQAMAKALGLDQGLGQSLDQGLGQSLSQELGQTVLASPTMGLKPELQRLAAIRRAWVLWHWECAPNTILSRQNDKPLSTGQPLRKPAKNQSVLWLTSSGAKNISGALA